MRYHLAWHVLLLNTYYSATANQPVSNNLIVVVVLDERGKNMSGWETPYYPAQQIWEWLEEHLQGIKKHKPEMTLRILRTNQPQQLSQDIAA
jgi:hypothetical protein